MSELRESIRFIGCDSQGATIFSIHPDCFEAAAQLLLRLLLRAEVTLETNEDEGLVFFKVNGDQIETRSIGHGWEGGWRPISLEEARQRIIELAPYNVHGTWSRIRYLIK